MRTAVAALAVLALIACARQEAPAPERVTPTTPERLTLKNIERKYERATSSPTPDRPAPGNVFLLVHLVEQPAREENRVWLDSVLLDWDGEKYNPKFASIHKSQSGSSGSLFSGPTTSVHPDEIEITFEVPESATLRSITVPQPISLFETPVSIVDPRRAPKVLHRVEPVLPAFVRWRAPEELIKLEVLVRADGKVAGARNIHGPREFAEPAAAAVRQWKYEPYVVDGKAVPVLIQVHFNFRVNS
jgi:hypothetical protein